MYTNVAVVIAGYRPDGSDYDDTVRLAVCLARTFRVRTMRVIEGDRATRRAVLDALRETTTGTEDLVIWAFSFPPSTSGPGLQCAPSPSERFPDITAGDLRDAEDALRLQYTSKHLGKLGYHLLLLLDPAPPPGLLNIFLSSQEGERPVVPMEGNVGQRSVMAMVTPYHLPSRHKPYGIQSPVVAKKKHTTAFALSPDAEDSLRDAPSPGTPFLPSASPLSPATLGKCAFALPDTDTSSPPALSLSKSLPQQAASQLPFFVALDRLLGDPATFADVPDHHALTALGVYAGVVDMMHAAMPDDVPSDAADVNGSCYGGCGHVIRLGERVDCLSQVLFPPPLPWHSRHLPTPIRTTIPLLPCPTVPLDCSLARFWKDRWGDLAWCPFDEFWVEVLNFVSTHADDAAVADQARNKKFTPLHVRRILTDMPPPATSMTEAEFADQGIYTNTEGMWSLGEAPKSPNTKRSLARIASVRRRRTAHLASPRPPRRILQKHTKLLDGVYSSPCVCLTSFQSESHRVYPWRVKQVLLTHECLLDNFATAFARLLRRLLMMQESQVAKGESLSEEVLRKRPVSAGASSLSSDDKQQARTGEELLGAELENTSMVEFLCQVMAEAKQREERPGGVGASMEELGEQQRSSYLKLIGEVEGAEVKAKEEYDPPLSPRHARDLRRRAEEAEAIRQYTIPDHPWLSIISRHLPRPQPSAPKPLTPTVPMGLPYLLLVVDARCTSQVRKLSPEEEAVIPVADDLRRMGLVSPVQLLQSGMTGISKLHALHPSAATRVLEWFASRQHYLCNPVSFDLLRFSTEVSSTISTLSEEVQQHLLYPTEDDVVEPPPLKRAPSGRRSSVWTARLQTPMRMVPTKGLPPSKAPAIMDLYHDQPMRKLWHLVLHATLNGPRTDFLQSMVEITRGARAAQNVPLSAFGAPGSDEMGRWLAIEGFQRCPSLETMQALESSTFSLRHWLSAQRDEAASPASSVSKKPPAIRDVERHMKWQKQRIFFELLFDMEKKVFESHLRIIALREPERFPVIDLRGRDVKPDRPSTKEYSEGVPLCAIQQTVAQRVHALECSPVLAAPHPAMPPNHVRNFSFSWGAITLGGSGSKVLGVATPEKLKIDAVVVGDSARVHAECHFVNPFSTRAPHRKHLYLGLSFPTCRRLLRVTMKKPDGDVVLDSSVVPFDTSCGKSDQGYSSERLQVPLGSAGDCDEMTFELVWLQVMDWQPSQSCFRLQLPTVMQVYLAEVSSEVTSSLLRNRLSISLSVASGMGVYDVQSPTHPLVATPHRSPLSLIRYSPVAGPLWSNRQFVAVIRYSRDYHDLYGQRSPLFSGLCERTINPPLTGKPPEGMESLMNSRSAVAIKDTAAQKRPVTTSRPPDTMCLTAHGLHKAYENRWLCYLSIVPPANLPPPQHPESPPNELVLVIETGAAIAGHPLWCIQRVLGGYLVPEILSHFTSIRVVGTSFKEPHQKRGRARRSDWKEWRGVATSQDESLVPMKDFIAGLVSSPDAVGPPDNVWKELVGDVAGGCVVVFTADDLPSPLLTTLHHRLDLRFSACTIGLGGSPTALGALAAGRGGVVRTCLDHALLQDSLVEFVRVVIPPPILKYPQLIASPPYRVVWISQDPLPDIPSRVPFSLLVEVVSETAEWDSPPTSLTLHALSPCGAPFVAEVPLLPTDPLVGAHPLLHPSFPLNHLTLPHREQCCTPTLLVAYERGENSPTKESSVVRICHPDGIPLEALVAFIADTAEVDPRTVKVIGQYGDFSDICFVYLSVVAQRGAVKLLQRWCGVDDCTVLRRPACSPPSLAMLVALLQQCHYPAYPLTELVVSTQQTAPRFAAHHSRSELQKWCLPDDEPTSPALSETSPLRRVPLLPAKDDDVFHVHTNLVPPPSGPTALCPANVELVNMAKGSHSRALMRDWGWGRLHCFHAATVRGKDSEASGSSDRTTLLLRKGCVMQTGT